MSPNLTLTLLAGALVAAGVYLILERSLTRILVGVLLASNGVNVLFLVASGAAGGAPITGVTDPQDMSDPLPQAFVLTAIVITLAVAAFLLALIHRTWALDREDDVTEDPSDASVRRRLESGEQFDEDEFDTSGSEEVPDADADGGSDTDGDRPATVGAGGRA